MDFKEYLVENSEKDMISKIYHNDMEDLQCISESKEYLIISKKIKKLERELLKNFTKDKYIEYTNERNSIEAEDQFKLGFKTAIKIILQALK